MKMKLSGLSRLGMAGLVGGSVAMAGLAGLGGFAASSASAGTAPAINYQCSGVTAEVSWTSATDGSVQGLQLTAAAGGKGTLGAAAALDATTLDIGQSYIGPGATVTLDKSTQTVEETELGADGADNTAVLVGAWNANNAKATAQPSAAAFSYSATSNYQDNLTASMTSQSNGCTAASDADLVGYPTAVNGSGAFTKEVGNGILGLEQNIGAFSQTLNYPSSTDGSWTALNQGNKGGADTMAFKAGGTYTPQTATLPSGGTVTDPGWTFNGGTIAGAMKTSDLSASLVLGGVVACTVDQLAEYSGANLYNYCDGGPDATDGVNDPTSAAEELLPLFNGGGEAIGGDNSAIVEIVQVVAAGATYVTPAS